MTPVPTHLTRAAYIDRSPAVYSSPQYTLHKREGLPFAAAIPCAGWPFSFDASLFGEDVGPPAEVHVCRVRLTVTLIWLRGGPRMHRATRKEDRQWEHS